MFIAIFKIVIRWGMIIIPFEWHIYSVILAKYHYVAIYEMNMDHTSADANLELQ